MNPACKTQRLIAAMREAVRTEQPRTAKQWAADFNTSPIGVYTRAYENDLHRAVIKTQREPQKTFEVNKRNGRRTVLVSKSVLVAAGLDRCESVRVSVEPGKITLARDPERRQA